MTEFESELLQQKWTGTISNPPWLNKNIEDNAENSAEKVLEVPNLRVEIKHNLQEESCPPPSESNIVSAALEDLREPREIKHPMIHLSEEATANASKNAQELVENIEASVANEYECENQCGKCKVCREHTCYAMCIML